jgi:RNase P/RNase MRP subunit POP5
VEQSLIKLIKRRYIAFHIESRIKISKREIYHALIKEISYSANVSTKKRPYMWIIKFDVETGLGIIRCGHNALNQILQSIQESRGLLKELKVRTLGTSGSIKTLKRKFLSKEFK